MPTRPNAIRLTIFLLLMVLSTRGSDADPIQPVRKIAEWEPAAGTLIRWPLGIPSDLVVELAEGDSLYVLVETQSQENSARNAFSSWGVNTDHVRYIRTNTYSHWTRDWGPQDVFDGDGVWGIGDPWFTGYPWVPGCFAGPGPPHSVISGGAAMAIAAENVARMGTRGWEEDDAVNDAVATDFGAPLHALPAFCTGGNIMVDGHGTAFSTRQMLAENAPYHNEPEFRDVMEAWLGITDYHFFENPETHGIQHIDCYAKLLDEETVIVKEVTPGNPEYDCIEDMVDEFATLTNVYGRPYTIIRVYCAAYSGWDVAAYTNSLILNNKVLVPLFGVSSDQPALDSYRAAMPGYEVIGFPYGSWYYYDALHCRTMAIFDRHMLRIWHRRLDAVVPPAAEYPITAMIDDRSEMGLVAESLLLRWRFIGDETWNDVPLVETAAPDSFAAAIPGQTPGSAVEYYLSASDYAGRTETLPRSAPDGTYLFVVDDAVDTPIDIAMIATGRLGLAPNPFRSEIGIRLDLPISAPVTLSVYDAAGRCVRTLFEGVPAARPGKVRWNGRDTDGESCAPGVYFIMLRTPVETRGGRCLLLK